MPLSSVTDAFATFDDEGDEWERPAASTPVTAPPSPWSPTVQWLPDQEWLHGKQPAGKALATAERAMARRCRWESSFGRLSMEAEGVAAAAAALGAAETAYSDSDDEGTGMREMLQRSPPSRSRQSAAQACALSEELGALRLRSVVQAQARSPLHSAAPEPRRSPGSLATGGLPPRHSPVQARSSCSPATGGCGGFGGGGSRGSGGAVSSARGSTAASAAASWGCRLKVYVDEAALLHPSMVAAAEQACGGTARLRVSERGAPHVNVAADSETALEAALLSLLSMMGERADAPRERSLERVVLLRWPLRSPAVAPAALLRRWQAAIDALQADRPLRKATVRLQQGGGGRLQQGGSGGLQQGGGGRAAGLSVLLHADGWHEATRWMASSVACAVAQLLCHVRHGDARFLALHLRSPRRVTFLASAHGRAALRALATQSGALPLLLCKPAPSVEALPSPWLAPGGGGGRGGWGGGPAPPATMPPRPPVELQGGDGGGGEALLVLCAPRLLLEAAESLVNEWLRSTAP